jgi:simple sugar transport system substrate-binding protein
MEVGVKAFQDANPDVVTSESGPATADAAQQLQIVEDLIARGVNALAVVPMDPAVIEGALKRAMDRGIVVVTHEADNQKNTQADIEAFDNATYGATLNERLAQCMGGKGKWTNFVGSLGSRTHIQWVDAGAENAKKHPGMELVDEKNESFDDVNKTYEKAKEILRKHPDIRGFQGSAGNDVIGIGRAIEEAGLQGKVCLVGTGLPNPSAQYLEWPPHAECIPRPRTFLACAPPLRTCCASTLQACAVRVTANASKLCLLAFPTNCTTKSIRTRGRWQYDRFGYGGAQGFW